MACASRERAEDGAGVGPQLAPPRRKSLGAGAEWVSAGSASSTGAGTPMLAASEDSPPCYGRRDLN
jgi:hypothetical protein